VRTALTSSGDELLKETQPRVDLASYVAEMVGSGELDEARPRDRCNRLSSSLDRTT
jgi:hypothetical protein